MQPGRASQTAVHVCMGRAMAHGLTQAARFSDPTALALLPDDARELVLRYRAGLPPRGLREGFQRAISGKRVSMMVARTIAVDDAARGVASPQLVILGAGLDGRAHRMAELQRSIVFEVDHPDSQSEKQLRAAALTPAATRGALRAGGLRARRSG